MDKGGNELMFSMNSMHSVQWFLTNNIPNSVDISPFLGIFILKWKLYHPISLPPWPTDTPELDRSFRTYFQLILCILLHGSPLESHSIPLRTSHFPPIFSSLRELFSLLHFSNGLQSFQNLRDHSEYVSSEFC